MNLVRENINFERGGDPLETMGIGLKKYMNIEEINADNNRLTAEYLIRVKGIKDINELESLYKDITKDSLSFICNNMWRDDKTPKEIGDHIYSLLKNANLVK